MAGYELEGEQLAERLKATGVFSEQEIEAIIENIMRGPLLPGEGRKVYPKDAAPKKTGATLPLANSHEPEGEMIDENLLKKLRRFNPGATMANEIQRALIPPVADGTLDTAARNASPRGTRPKVKTEAFDYILNYLVNEGFAKTEDSAKVIMSNMSEAWIKSILEQAPPPPFLPNSNDSPEVQAQKRREHNKKHSNYTGAGLGNRPVDGTGTGPCD